MIDAMWETYEFLRERQAKREHIALQPAPAVEFLGELNVALYRKALERKAPKLKDTPKWVFLYNIDLYYSKLGDVPPEKRLSLEAGSQHEISKGYGILLGGLDAGQDHRIC